MHVRPATTGIAVALAAGLVAAGPAAAAPRYPQVVVAEHAAPAAMRATVRRVNTWWQRTHDFVPCNSCMVRPPGSAILWTYYGGQGFFPNWVRAGRDVLRRKIRGDMPGLRTGAREILAASTTRVLPNGLRFRVIESAYRAPDGEPAPWRDAMGSGLVLTLIVPGLPEQPTARDLAVAKRTASEYLNSFGVHWRRGGLTEPGPGRGLWYLEYAYGGGARQRVLNGSMQALVSLDRFERQAEIMAATDPEWRVLQARAQDFVKRGVTELTRTLYRYDLGNGMSRYSLTRPGPAPIRYHTYHLQLLARLEAIEYLPARQRAVITRYRSAWGGTRLTTSLADDPGVIPPD